MESKEFTNYILSSFEVSPNTETIESCGGTILVKKLKHMRQKQIVNKFIEMNTKKKKCAHCDCTEGTFHVDHIVPLAKGEKDDIGNLQFLCEECNLKKSSQFDFNYSII